MTESAKTAATIYQELGPFAFLLICGSLTFGWLVYRIVMTQDRISDTLDSLNQRITGHDQRASDMHITCREHGKQLDKIHETLSEHTTQIQVLQEVVRR